MDFFPMVPQPKKFTIMCCDCIGRRIRVVCFQWSFSFNIQVRWGMSLFWFRKFGVLFLLNWLTIKNKREGLGIGRLSIFNKALFGKWCWRFATKRYSFWKKVTIGKYGEEKGGWCSRVVKERYMVWKVIKSGWEAFSSRIKFKMGNRWGMKF